MLNILFPQRRLPTALNMAISFLLLGLGGYLLSMQIKLHLEVIALVSLMVYFFAGLYGQNRSSNLSAKLCSIVFHLGLAFSLFLFSMMLMRTDLAYIPLILALGVLGREFPFLASVFNGISKGTSNDSTVVIHEHNRKD